MTRENWSGTVCQLCNECFKDISTAQCSNVTTSDKPVFWFKYLKKLPKILSRHAFCLIQKEIGSGKLYDYSRAVKSDFLPLSTIKSPKIATYLKSPLLHFQNAF